MTKFHQEVLCVFVSSVVILIGVTSTVFLVFEHSRKDDGKLFKKIISLMMFLVSSIYIGWISCMAMYEAVEFHFKTRRYNPPTVKTPLCFKLASVLMNLWNQKTTIGLILLSCFCLNANYGHTCEGISLIKQNIWDEKPPIQSHFSDGGSGASIESHSPTSYPKPLFVPMELAYDPSIILFDDEICWHMRGHNGFITIILANKVIIDGITLQSFGNSKAQVLAPKDILIVAANETSQNVVLEQVFFSAVQNEQYFKIQDCPIPVTHLTLYILNNHGHKECTVLCRIIVYGVKVVD